MAQRYTANFTLTDIFNNKRLKDKMPLINYKEEVKSNGKVSRTTNMKTLNRLVFDTALSAARPFYKPILQQRSGDTMVISGNLIGDHNAAVDAVYIALVGQKSVISYTVNNMAVIRSALKEAEKNKRKYGIDTKLKLRAQSMLEIEGMTKRQTQGLLNNIMENIYYSDNFPETQKKFGLKGIFIGELNYDQRKAAWKARVGE